MVLGDRALDHVVRGTMRAVGEHDSRLQRSERALVDQVKEVQLGDGGIARRPRDQLRVVLALLLIRHGRDVLAAAVRRGVIGRNLRLIAGLVDECAHVRTGWIADLAKDGLPGAVEHVPPGLFESIEVHAADVRPRESNRRRVGVDVGIAVQRDVVGDRRRPPARAIRGGNCLEEPNRGF